MSTILEGKEEVGGVRLKKGSMAKRQLRMRHEEVELLKRCAAQCWGNMVVPRNLRKELGIGKRERGRSATCP